MLGQLYLSKKTETVSNCKATCEHENYSLLTSTIAGPISAFWASSAARGFRHEHGSVLGLNPAKKKLQGLASIYTE